MDIGRLTAGLLADAEKEAKEITDAAKAEKKKLLEEEQKKAMLLISHAEKEAEDFVAAQRRERIARAKLEARKLLGEARESVARDARDTIYKRISSLRNEKGYAAFLKKCVKQGLQELASPKPTVLVCKGDGKLLKGISAQVSEKLSGMGGAIIQSRDGSVRVDFTLETIFLEKKEAMREILYARMFG